MKTNTKSYTARMALSTLHLTHREILTFLVEYCWFVIWIFLFLGILIPFNAYTIHRINKLYQQVLLSSQSGRNCSIKIGGRDEIAKLGNEIEFMRISLLSLLENEEK